MTQKLLEKFASKWLFFSEEVAYCRAVVMNIVILRLDCSGPEGKFSRCDKITAETPEKKAFVMLVQSFPAL